jgi:serine/threonine-protein kinase
MASDDVDPRPDDPDLGIETVTGLRRGAIIAGKYRIDALLGSGGMGVVVAAHHVELDERVAIKFLSRELLSNEEARSRFGMEARAAVKIKSESAARIFDVGTLENGIPYIVMELLEGVDLEQMLLRDGPLPTELAIDFVTQACVALAEAHSLGIVHRDVKPSNLFCTRRGEGRSSIKVLDFGISKATRAAPPAGGSVTAPDALVGSPLHMSPEQMRGAGEVDGRADIWAIGVTLYELLAGVPAFSGDAFVDIAIQVTLRQPPSLRERRPDVPEVLEQVILKCLEKDASARYQTVAELTSALAPFGSPRAAFWAEECGAFSGGPAPVRSSSPATRTPSITPTTTPVSGIKTGIRIKRIHVGISAAVVALGAVTLLRVRARAPSAAQQEAVVMPASSQAPPIAVPPASPSVSPPSVDVEQLPTAAASARVQRRDARPPESRAPSPDAGTTAKVIPLPVARTNPCDPPYTIDAAGHRKYKPECP